MPANRPIYSIETATHYRSIGVIVLKDLCDGNQLSVTNGAEHVIDDLIKTFPWFTDGTVVAYYATENKLDILEHDGLRFTGFSTADEGSIQILVEIINAFNEEAETL